jgi:hypothetical protein
MNLTTLNAFLFSAALCLSISSSDLRGQAPAANEAKPTFTAAQKEALAALYDHGGILIHLDEQRPGRPVVMIDFAGHPEFQDEWLQHLLRFPELTTVRLAETALTDSGLNQLKQLPKLTELILNDTAVTDVGLIKLADCKTLRTLAVSGTRVTEAGTTVLRKALPQLKIITEPPKESTGLAVNGSSATTGAEGVKLFSAAEIKKWRERLTELGQIPLETPNGWSKSRVEPAKLLTVFPVLKVREGYVLRAYVFKEDANSNGFVWALPADAEFPAPDDCPRLESHFLKPPKPFDALDDMMEVIAGDDSPESYLHASLLRRELKEFAGGWHGIQWGMNTVLDDSPWNQPPRSEEESMAMYPESKPEEWKWIAPRPENWKPEVRLEKDKAIVTFYSYTPLSVELDDGEMEKERIIRHVETYRRGKYRPLIVEKKLAEGPNAVAF